MLACNSDRVATRPVIKLQINYYTQQLGTWIEAVNGQITYTKVPAIAVSGTQMKEDLRKIKSRLESIEFH